MKQYHYTYLIYCNEPSSSLYGCIYYGKHSTNNLTDGYITSGKIIKRYIKKYPDGYYRKILHLYNSEEEVNKAEKNLIKNHLGNCYCLNIAAGGNGGNTLAGYSEEELKEFSDMCSRTHKDVKHKVNKEAHKKQSITLQNKYSSGEIVIWNKGQTKETNENVKQISEKISKTRKEKCATGEITVWNKGKTGVQEAWNKGRPVEEWMSEEGREHLSALAKTRTGSKNSFFGHTHSEENKTNHSKRMKLYHQAHKKVLCEDGKYHYKKIDNHEEE